MIFLKNSSEVIKSCEEKDGKIYVSTELTSAFSEELVTADGYTYNKGEFMTVDYILDAKTKVILSDKTMLVASDGTKREYAVFTVEYNVTRPELAQTMYEHATAKENLRTLTIITDPDTASEKTFTIKVRKVTRTALSGSGYKPCLRIAPAQKKLPRGSQCRRHGYMVKGK